MNQVSLINDEFLKYFEVDKIPLKLSKDGLTNSKVSFLIKDGIPRFIPDISYSTGNFSRLREEHSNLQIDSKNNTSDRLNTILNRTNWPKEFFKGKTILECGCGAGPDTEILINLGAKVLAVDIAGVDIAKGNLIGNTNYKNAQFVQDSINNLHLKPGSFDIVYCHRVLQHTPNPEETLNHILKYVKKDGAVFVHSYSNSKFQMWRWKYVLLPITRNLPPRLLYSIIKLYSWPIYLLTSVTERSRIGKLFNYKFVPFLNYRYSKKFKGKSNSFFVEYGIHDTFDALSPKYDKPIDPKKMKEIAHSRLNKEFEIFEDPGMTLLRTII